MMPPAMLMYQKVSGISLRRTRSACSHWIKKRAENTACPRKPITAQKFRLSSRRSQYSTISDTIPRPFSPSDQRLDAAAVAPAALQPDHADHVDDAGLQPSPGAVMRGAAAARPVIDRHRAHLPARA